MNATECMWRAWKTFQYLLLTIQLYIHACLMYTYLWNNLIELQKRKNTLNVWFSHYSRGSNVSHDRNAIPSTCCIRKFEFLNKKMKCICIFEGLLFQRTAYILLCFQVASRGILMRLISPTAAYLYTCQPHTCPDMFHQVGTSPGMEPSVASDGKVFRCL